MLAAGRARVTQGLCFPGPHSEIPSKTLNFSMDDPEKEDKTDGLLTVCSEVSWNSFLTQRKRVRNSYLER